MSDTFSIKNFIKTKQDKEYTIDELKVLAREISEVSRYNEESSLKILCRYACPNNNKIILTNKRNPLQTIQLLKDNLHKNNKVIIKKEDEKININVNVDKNVSVTNSCRLAREEDPHELFGPYGTDNYHNTNKSDKLNKQEKKRAEIFRVLDSKYYPPQRSKEWFELRDGMITASDGGTIVGLNPYEGRFAFVSKKAHGKPFKTNEHCYHGKKLEEVATMAYEYRMNVRVKEFGLCKHPKYDFLGASPDGIVSEYKLQTKTGKPWKLIEEEISNIEDKEKREKIIKKNAYKTKFVGRMLEIKCPKTRKILMDMNAPEVYGPYGEEITNILKDVKKGVCPAYYWVQVQLQLQCCELDECDFWQCEISEYKDKKDYINDSEKEREWISKQTGHEKGLLIQLMPKDIINEYINTTNIKSKVQLILDNAEFLYLPKIDMTLKEMDEWALNTISKLNKTHPTMVFDSIKYWRIDKTRNITIKRDDKWFEDNLKKFRKSWNMVKYFRKNKEKSELFRKYILIQETNRFGNIENNKFDKIFKVVNKIYKEPKKDATKKEKNKYKNFIKSIEKEILDSGFVEKEYNFDDELQLIQDKLILELSNDLTYKEKTKKIDEHKKLVKAIKNVLPK
jgi:putative phage-type endonuclease